jgi:hypothetical protein
MKLYWHIMIVYDTSIYIIYALTYGVNQCIIGLNSTLLINDGGNYFLEHVKVGIHVNDSFL